MLRRSGDNAVKVSTGAAPGSDRWFAFTKRSIVVVGVIKKQMGCICRPFGIVAVPTVGVEIAASSMVEFSVSKFFWICLLYTSPSPRD